MKQKGFHKRWVQVSSKVYKSASATRVFQRKYKHAVLAEPAWSGLASVASAGRCQLEQTVLKMGQDAGWLVSGPNQSANVDAVASFSSEHLLSGSA